MVESFFATLKAEFYYRRVWPTTKAARIAVGKWIEDRYNRRRGHASIGQISPVNFELQYSRQIPDSQKPHNPCPRNGGKAKLPPSRPSSSVLDRSPRVIARAVTINCRGVKCCQQRYTPA
jgi:hypothetical protein